MSTGVAMTVLLLAAAIGVSEVAAEPPAVKSVECMACHDGSGAIEIRSHVSHKVEVDYERIRVGSTAALKPSSATTPFGGSIAATLLVEGRVECATCHYTHEDVTGTPFRLRIPEGAMYVVLCTSCHDMSRL